MYRQQRNQTQVCSQVAPQQEVVPIKQVRRSSPCTRLYDPTHTQYSYRVNQFAGSNPRDTQDTSSYHTQNVRTNMVRAATKDNQTKLVRTANTPAKMGTESHPAEYQVPDSPCNFQPSTTTLQQVTEYAVYVSDSRTTLPVCHSHRHKEVDNILHQEIVAQSPRTSWTRNSLIKNSLRLPSPIITPQGKRWDHASGNEFAHEQREPIASGRDSGTHVLNPLNSSTATKLPEQLFWYGRYAKVNSHAYNNPRSQIPRVKQVTPQAGKSRWVVQLRH